MVYLYQASNVNPGYMHAYFCIKCGVRTETTGRLCKKCAAKIRERKDAKGPVEIHPGEISHEG